ncbi:hypothetical protein ABK040_014041 [Willaertia magna]
MFRANVMRSIVNALPKRGGHGHHELTNFTNGPPKKRTVLMFLGFVVGGPFCMAGGLWYTYVGSKHL